MRLWSLHPKYLDAKGLVALWREALLAQKVLRGKTRGYKNHPQLLRFKSCRDSERAIAAYLFEVWQEAAARGYEFNYRKIGPARKHAPLAVNRGQLHYEFRWLQKKLSKRDRKKFRANLKIKRKEAHPLFRVRAGAVEKWEVVN